MKRLTTALALVTASAPLFAQTPPEPLAEGTRIRLTTNPPAGAMASTGEFRMPGEPVGRNGEGITVTLDDREATFSLPGQRLEGRLLRADAETLTLRLRGAEEPVTVLRRSVSRLEVRRPGRSRVASAAIGAGVGAALGIGVALATWDDDDSYYFYNQAEGFQALTAGLAAVAGLGVGALAGLAVGGESWTAVDPGPSLRLAVLPTRGGAGAALSLGF